ncbi:MAG TPA: hypothetical protein VGE90_02070 [Chitinophaga sp.]
MRFSVFIICILVSQWVYAQPARMLSKHEIDSIFTGLEYPVFRGWEYKDPAGLHYLLLMEKYSQTKPKDTITTNIAAVCMSRYVYDFRQVHVSNLVKEAQIPSLRWRLRDALEADEKSIWFFTRYISPIDIDGDGYVDPLIIYGTSPKEDGSDHRRLKMLLYYRYSKVAIRAVTGTLDAERSIQYDAAFYKLPQSIQSYMKQLLKQISKDQHFILAD